MTVSELAASAASGGFCDSFGRFLGIDMSENGGLAEGDLTAVTEGVISIEADLSAKSAVREFVDGHKAVAVSEWAEIKIRFLLISGDEIQERIMECAHSGVSVRCVFGDGKKTEFSGNMLITSAESKPHSVYGTAVTAVFAAC